jgi:hypothetical protein
MTEEQKNAARDQFHAFFVRLIALGRESLQSGEVDVINIIPALQAFAELTAFANEENGPLVESYIQGIAYAGTRAANRWPDRCHFKREDVLIHPAPEVVQ